MTASITGTNARGGLAKTGGSTPVARTAPGTSSSNLSTTNGVSTPVSTPVVTPVPTAGPSDALKSMSIANSPTVTTPAGPSDALHNMSVALAPKVSRPIATPAASAVASPKTAAQYQSELLKASQGEINNINNYASQALEALKPVQEERLRETSSVNTLTGLAGSSEANVTTGVTTDKNTKESNLVRSAAASQIGGILTAAKTKAIELAQTAQSNFRLDTAAAETTRKAHLEESQKNAATLAASGVTFDGLKATDPEAHKALADAVGGEEMLKAQFTLNRPVDQILDKKIENGKYIVTYQNPLDGKVRIETLDLGLPPQYTKTVDAGNRILAIPDNWDGDPKNLITINKGLTPGQSVKGSGAGAGGSTYKNDLDALIGTTQAIIPSKFGQTTFAKQIASARNDADKINLIASIVLSKADSATKTDFTNQAVGIKQVDKAIKMLDNNTQTGVLQAGAQYAFNLAGEDYDPKLAQLNQLLISAIQPYRNSVTGAAWGAQEDGEYQQLFGSTKYSPAELKQRLLGIKEILASKSATALGSYVNPMGTYGDPFSTGNYSAAGNQQSGQLIGPDGQAYDASALSADEYQDAINSGYKPS